MTLTVGVLGRARKFGGKAALVDGVTGQAMSYDRLWESIHRTAAGLIRLGLGQGDVFAICLPNQPEFCVAFHGVLTAAGVVTTVSPAAAPDEIVFQLEASRARFLLVGPENLDKGREVARRSGVEKVLVLGAPRDGAVSFDSLSSEEGTPPLEAPRPDDLAVLPYSSGTTGFPKGVMLTHGNLMANLLQLRQVDVIAQDDRAIAVLPFCHIYGMQAVMNLGLLAGATLVTLPRFDLEQFLATMQEHRVTRASVVPPIVLSLAKDPAVDDYDLSSLQRVLSGAAPLGADLTRACAERLGCPVIQGYGLTEASPVTHLVPRHGDLRPGSIGLPLPGTECRIVDLATGADLGPGRTGELWVRGAQVMRGYLNDPAATAEVLDGDGWLHTGDLGYVDEDGYYYVVDRVKEMIKYKGYQVAPAELEAVLTSHPLVADAAVVPSPDDEAGEVPKAFVVLAGQASPDELVAFVAQRVAPAKRVRRVEMVTRIPRSPSGKILRRVLIGQERDRARARRAPPDPATV